MKKPIILLLTIILALTMVSCNAVNKIDVNKTTEAQGTNTVKETPNTQPEAQEQNKGLLKLAWEGKITGFNTGVGASLAEVIAELGEPIALEHFEGSSYISYEKANFMMDRIVESTSETAEILGISVSDGYELYGVKVGMNAEEIKGILGSADQEYMESDEEGMWKLDYNCGEYKLTIYFVDKNSPSTAAYLTHI